LGIYKYALPQKSLERNFKRVSCKQKTYSTGEGFLFSRVIQYAKTFTTLLYHCLLERLKTPTTVHFEHNILVCGLVLALTTSQAENFIRIKKHWQVFNQDLKKYALGQQPSAWQKYGITFKENEQYFYLAAIPLPTQNIPAHFAHKVLPQGAYALFTHRGKMEDIKQTLFEIYKKSVPTLNMAIEDHQQVGFLHVEKYDHRFQWDKAESVIDLYLPLKKNQV